MEVSLLLDGVANLQEKLLVDQGLNATDGEMRHKILTVTEITQVIEGIQKVGFEVEQGLWLVVHAEPQHPRHIVAAKETRAVKVHGEGLVPLGHLLASFNDVGDVVDRRAAKKFQRQVDVFRPAIVDEFFMLEVFLQTLHHDRILRPRRDMDS